MFTAGYGTIGQEPTENKSFDSYDEAKEWVDSIIPSLPEPDLIEHLADEDHEEPWTEEICSWHVWIAADN